MHMKEKKWFVENEFQINTRILYVTVEIDFLMIKFSHNVYNSTV